MRRIMLIGMMVASSAFAAKPKAEKPVTAEDYAKEADVMREKIIALGKGQITYGLNDPDSARFRNVFLSPKGRAVCGEVNARNRMGGYVGFRRFIAAGDRVGIEGDGSYFADTHWQERCIKDELDGDPPRQ